MTLALTNSFAAGGQIVLSQWDTNFTQIKNELDAFPTNGAIGTGVVREIDIAQRAITPDKIENNIQFTTLPKCLTTTTMSDFSHDDHLVSQLYALTQFAAVFSEGDFTGGEILFDEDTASISEKVVFPNGRILVVGYQKCNTTTAKADTTDLTAHGLAAVYAGFPIVCGTKGIYGQVSELTCVMTALTPTALTVYLYPRSVANGSIFGYFYMVIGK